MKNKKKLFILCAALVLVVGSSVFIANRFMNDTVSDEEVTEENDEEIEEKTFSSEYVANVDSVAKSIIANMSSNGNVENYCTTKYGDGSSIKDYYTIDDDNAYDKSCGKYENNNDNVEESNADKPKELLDLEKEAKDEDSIFCDIKECEDRGELFPLGNGMYMASSYDVIDKSKLEPYDVVYYYTSKDTVRPYVNMNYLSKDNEQYLIKYMGSKSSVSINAYVSLRIYDDGKLDDNPPIIMTDYTISYDDKLKLILSDDGNDITDDDSFKDISRKNCFSFLYDYMKREGVDLNMCNSEPCTEWLLDKRYKFKDNQPIIDKLKNAYDCVSYNKSLCTFDFSYEENADPLCISDILTSVQGKLENGKNIIICRDYLINFQ